MTGCLLRFLLLLVLFASALVLFTLWSPEPFESIEHIHPAAGILCGLFAWFIAMSCFDIRRYRDYQRKLNKPIFEEGKPLVISGHLLSEEQLLRAPFSGEECLGYHYKVRYTAKMGSHATDWTCYEGYALVPSVIQSHIGEYKILAKPKDFFFSDFKMEKYMDIFEKAEEYLSDLEFTETIHEPGGFKVDKKFGDTIDMREKGCSFEESIIKPYDSGLISGVYSSNPQGIAPHSDDIFNPFKIILNGESGMLKKVKNRWIGIYIFLGLISITVLVYYFVIVK